LERMHLQKFQDEYIRQSEVAAQVCVHPVVARFSLNWMLSPVSEGKAFTCSS